MTVFRVVIMVNVSLVMENLCAIAIMNTLEQTVLSEISVSTIYVAIVQHVLMVNQIIHVIVPMAIMGNFVN